jgi:hypothetical protein
MNPKVILGGIAVALTFLAYIPYYRDILKGKTRPHIYSWSLWGLLTILLVALQMRGGAGAATWVTAAAGLLCIGVVFLSIKNGRRDITRSDTIVGIISLLAIFFWLVVDQPITSIILVIIADMFAFIPTIRKSYNDPHSETLSLYITNAFRFCLALGAVENYTFLSTSWIVAWVIGNLVLSLILIVRRRQLK